MSGVDFSGKRWGYRDTLLTLGQICSLKLVKEGKEVVSSACSDELAHLLMYV